jgi:phosphoribosyl 1,2-cyclic phosphate phosphodiesterase
MPVFCPEGSHFELLRRFPYVFDEAVQAPPGSTIPRLRLTGFEPLVPVSILGHEFTPLPVPHGSTTVYGFRVGDLGYITDGKSLPPDTVEALQGVKVLVLNALWWGNPPPTHFNVEEALAASELVGPERTYLIHMTHEVRHQELLDRLPAGVEPAYDGLSVEVGEGTGPAPDPGESSSHEE